MVASPYLTVLKKEPLSVPPEKAEGGDDLLGLEPLAPKTKTLCCLNPYFTQVFSDTVAYLEDRLANGPFEIKWELPPQPGTLDFSAYSPWKPARTTAEEVLDKALAAAKTKVLERQNGSGEVDDRALDAALFGVRDVVGGALQQAFKVGTLNPSAARKQLKQVGKAKESLSDAVQAASSFTRGVLWKAVADAKVGFVASGEYATVWERTYAFGRTEDETRAERAKALEAFVGEEIARYFRSNSFDREDFGFVFKCKKNEGEWVITDKVGQNAQKIYKALEQVPRDLELQKKAAQKAIEALLKKGDPQQAAEKFVRGEVEASARRVAKGVVALTFSGAELKEIFDFKDSLVTVRALLRALKPLDPREAQELSLFLEERLRCYMALGLKVKGEETGQPRVPQEPVRSPKNPGTATALPSRCEL